MLLVGCSAKKSRVDESNVDLTDLDETPIEQVEADSVVPLDTEVLASDEAEDEMIVEEYDEQNRFAETEEEAVAEDSDYVASSELDDSSVDLDASEDEDEMLISDAQDITKAVEKSEYIIQKNDTLMLAAWKIYGDTSRWRELESLNQDKLHNGHIWTGETLVFNRPEVEFDWSPEGSPYVIVRGDTLGLVSEKVYSDKKHWKAIWYNNRDLIRDPDLIFAGFTIFYKDLDQVNEREIASKMKMFRKQK